MQDVSKNMELYEAVRAVPQEAKKQINGGRLKGMTDINPMWRIKKLTELFGPCGIGWIYTPPRREFVSGANGEIAVIVDTELRVNIDGKWSELIPGTGGAMYVAKEKGGLYTDDEAPKKALTDALSVACKTLGIGADVYFAADKSSKYAAYTDTQTEEPPKQEKPNITPQQIAAIKLKCTADEIGKLLAKYKISELSAMPAATAEKIIKQLEARQK